MRKIVAMAALALFVPICSALSGEMVGKQAKKLADDDKQVGVTDSSEYYIKYDKRPIQAGIHVLARTCGDSVVLRWSGEDYATQQYLDQVGVMIVRYDYAAENGNICDTLAVGIKPWSQERWQDYYSEQDSIALMAMGVMFSNNGLKPDQTKSAPGTIGSFMDIYQDQMMRMAMRLLLAEWRRDIAEHMGLRFVDYSAKAHHEYEYIVRPMAYDSLTNMITVPGIVTVKNSRYVKPDYNVTVGDSVIGPMRVRLWWDAFLRDKDGNEIPNTRYSSFEIERRKVGETEWTRCNSLPYWNLSPIGNDDNAEYDCSYSDLVPEVGEYEYRIFAHDAFGDLTNPTAIHRVTVPDMEAPLPPDLVLVEIDRQDPNDLSKKVMATFHFEKDTIEQDLLGFMPMYYNERQTGKKWKDLSPKMLAPTDSVFTCDMTGFSSGMVVIAAYDTAHNVSYSMPRMVQIKDVKAPGMMRNFKAETSIEDGTITLTWEPDSVDDDIEYFEVTYANDTTHTFALVSQGKQVTECVFVDTVAMDVNQKYIYYKVRAIDFSTNQGEDTPPLQVIRPTRLKPSVAHLLSSHVDSLGIHMEWACSNEQIMDHHILLRRLEGQESWDTLGIYNADSVKLADNVIKVNDCPEFNRTHEYQYCMESFSCTGVSSGHSLVLCTMFEGPRYLNIPLTLSGVYDEKNNQTVLSWEVNNGKNLEGDWYFSLFRKGANDDYHTFYLSVPSGKRERQSKLLSPGQAESYYLKVIYRDGRESRASNVVTVRRPE